MGREQRPWRVCGGGFGVPCMEVSSEARGGVLECPSAEPRKPGSAPSGLLAVGLPSGRGGWGKPGSPRVQFCSVRPRTPPPAPPGVSPAHTASLWGRPVVFLRSEGSGLCSLYIFRVCFSCFSFESSWCPTSLVVHVLRCHYFLICRETKCKLEGISTSCSHENCNRRAFDLWMRRATRNGVSDFLRSQLILPK